MNEEDPERDRATQMSLPQERSTAQGRAPEAPPSATALPRCGTSLLVPPVGLLSQVLKTKCFGGGVRGPPAMRGWSNAQARLRRLVPPCNVPEGDSPLSLYAIVLSSKVVLASDSRHQEEKEEESLFKADAVD